MRLSVVPIALDERKIVVNVGEWGAWIRIRPAGSCAGYGIGQGASVQSVNNYGKSGNGANHHATDI